ncbi:MAG: imidazole glycerol phosphate synthase subunit HisH [Christensenellales bacterium]
MIAIIDYGMGNLCSVQNALKAIGASSCITSDEHEIKHAERIILPGVGAFPDAIKKLERTGLIETLKSEAKAGKPFLGICLGMQIMFEGSEEFGYHEGLGLVKGTVTLMRLNKKVPHMGWNNVEAQKGCSLFVGIENEYFYFIHSYWKEIETEADEDVAGITVYEKPFVSAVGRDCMYGVQFHPEKSGDVGIQLLKNFIQL